MKECSKCGEMKFMDEFGKDASQKDGKNIYCLFCSRKISREWKRKNTAKKVPRKRNAFNGLSPEDVSYFAGIVDGEGSIVIALDKGNNCYRLQLTVVNTNHELIKWIVSKFGGRVVVTEAGSNRKKRYTWGVSSWGAFDVLEVIKNKLIIKKEQALLAIEFQQLKRINSDGIEHSDEMRGIKQQYKTNISHLNKGGATCVY